eukprot:CAMPEP_0197833452 /NCGR_PEP_ID=MMETSP1437-20131217/19084_1 /TAXON_ID=49252 ORGANISM="Eucampia antarctica, Strain CCMP1452" /NCGR_SAMPLE_ID=MMETSP1437 /ASSEMBLY_ACC=CAM_ASM_001096 /LENGTH=101 /DNA_ID=CAMNT_0043437523 /DNA_START=226 /DNA_END=527 /DNA_ORIENTATION=+
MNQNRLWYRELPDEVLVAWAAKGTTDGPVGYFQPLIHKINDGLLAPSDVFNQFFNTCDIKAVLPIRDESTGEAKLLYFKDGTKFMVVQGIVTSRTDVSKNT